MEATKKISSGSLSKSGEIWSRICNEVSKNVSPLSKLNTVYFHGKEFIVFKTTKDDVEITFVTLEGVVCMVEHFLKLMKKTIFQNIECLVRKTCRIQDFSEFDDIFEKNLSVVDFCELNEDFVGGILQSYQQNSESSNSKTHENHSLSINDAKFDHNLETDTQTTRILSLDNVKSLSDNGQHSDFSSSKSSKLSESEYEDDHKTQIIMNKNRDNIESFSEKSLNTHDFHNQDVNNSLTTSHYQNPEATNEFRNTTGFFAEDKEKISKVTIDFNVDDDRRIFEDETEKSMFSKVDVSESFKNDFLFLPPKSDHFFCTRDSQNIRNLDNLQFDFAKQWPGTPMDSCFINNPIYPPEGDLEAIRYPKKERRTLLSDDQSDDNDFMRKPSPQKKQFAGPANGARPFICHFRNCNRAFKRFEHLKRHYRIHTGERPFKCKFPGCQKSFARSDNLNQHLKVHNGGLNFVSDQRSNGYRYSGKDDR